MPEEQYPSVSQYITQIDNKDTWLLETYAYSLTPLIAFYLSYMPFIEIVKVDGLKEALSTTSADISHGQLSSIDNVSSL